MDFITGLLEVDQYNTLWVIMDCLTKIAYFIAYKETMGPKDCANIFLLHVV
jgi:hypothetical protein